MNKILLSKLHVNFADLLREGDELLEINGVPVTGKSADEIVTLMVHVLVQ